MDKEMEVWYIMAMRADMLMCSVVAKKKLQIKLVLLTEYRIK
jgi:hypothetical protein